MSHEKPSAYSPLIELLRGGDRFRKDGFKDAAIRLVAQVTARAAKRD